MKFFSGWSVVGTKYFFLYITSLRDVWREESPIFYRYYVPKPDKRHFYFELHPVIDKILVNNETFIYFAV